MRTRLQRAANAVALTGLLLQLTQCVHQVPVAPTKLMPNEIPDAVTTLDGTLVTFDDRYVGIVHDTLRANVNGRPFQLPADSIKILHVTRPSLLRTAAALVGTAVVLAGLALATF